MIKTITKISVVAGTLLAGSAIAQNPVISTPPAFCQGQSTSLSVNDFLNKGLVAYYPFNGNTNDLSGNAHNATATGVTLATDRFGVANRCYEFAGTSTYVQCPPATYFSGDYTISGWVNITNAEVWSRMIDFGNGPSSDNVLISLNPGGSGHINHSVYNGGSGSSLDSPDPLTLNQWVQITTTRVGNTVLLFVNGIPVYQNTGGMYAPNNVVRNNNYIGLSNWGSDGGVYGRMDDIRIYDHGLSVAEVAQLFNYENTAEAETAYSWSTGDSGTEITITPSGTTTYSVTATRDGVVSTGSIVVTPGLTDEPVTASASALICSGNGTITTATQEGVNYYLRNDLNDTIIAGPVAGTGSTVSFNTGNISASTTYNVYAVKPTGALELNGSDYGVIPASTGINSQFGSNQITAEGWFYPAVSTSYPMLIGESYLGDGNVKFSLYQDGTTIYGGFYDSGWHQISATITLNTWQHIACTYDQSELKLYINGALIASTPETASLPLGTEEWRVGLRWDLPDHYTGKIDELRIWNTARTQSEIQSGMNTCLTGTEPNLVLYYNFEEGTGTTLTDLAGGDQSGTLVNSDETAWAAGRETCSTCTIEMTAKPTITINPIADQVITNTNLICTGDATISLAGSEMGIDYFLRDESNDSLIAAAAGTGSAIDFTVTNLSDTTTYNIYAAKPGNAIAFNGSNYAETPLSGNLQFGTGDFSIEYWSKTSNSNTMVAVGGAGSGFDYWIGVASGLASVSISGSSALQGSTNISDNQWHHIAGIRSGNTLMIYVDGVLENSETNTNDASPTGVLAIGAFGGVGYNYVGTLDEVKIWSVARSATEVQSDMNSCMTGSEPGLSAYYKFENAGNLSTLVDAAGADNNGTLYNMNTSDWVTGTVVCSMCTLEMTTKPTVLVTPILDQTPSATASTVCFDGSSSITIPSSQVGVNYYLNSTNLGPVEGPVAGTGSALSFNVDNLQDGSDIYSVYAENASGSCNYTMSATVSFTVIPFISTTQTITLCAGESLTVGSSTYNSAGSYTDVLAGATCDSTVYTTLTIRNAIDNSTVIDNQGYINANLTGAGIAYAWIDCNDASPATLSTSQAYLPTVNGDYAVIIDDNGCVDTSACVPYYSTGVNENANAGTLKIYPNPNAGEFTIQAVAAGTYSIVNELGQLVQTVSLNAGTNFKCSVSGLKNGVYFLSGTIDGRVIKQKIVVVN